MAVRRGRSPHGERGLKYVLHDLRLGPRTSLSSRRAWIEITGGDGAEPSAAVALLTESVD